MQRAPAWLAVLGTLFIWLAAPATAHAASIWVTLAAGLPGAESPSANTEFYFDNPHGPNIAVTSLTGGVSAEAATGGGNSFFGGAGTPVLLNVGDGSAYIASGSAPPAARSFGAGGVTPSSSAPVAGGSTPTNAALLGVNLAEPDANGKRSLTASITDSLGNPLGSGTVNVPDGGWWVIGLGPDTRVPPDPVPAPTPIPEPPVTNPPAPGNTAATPEPGTLALAAVGSGAAYAWRRTRNRITV